MSFRQIIEMLSKGSAQAVTTLNSASDEAAKLKKYLYVPTPVEKALTSALDESTAKRILFLCGSSGDGKSEVFRRVYEKYASEFEFHLDATHSFDPGKNAIQTLDDRFRAYKSSERPLVVGINIGMLGNYEADGADEHNDIKDAISQFLKGESQADSEFVFINFESFPKFDLKGQKVEAPFIGQLLKKICTASDSNPIYTEFLTSNPSTRLHQNYKLLCVPEIQSRICALLFYAHLKFDQFLTARGVLDFVFQVLSGPGTLFDNLFSGNGSELVESLQKLDPCHARSKRLDLFQVKASLNLYDADFEMFRDATQVEFGLDIQEPRTWVRLFFVMQDLDLSNNYHHRFREDLRKRLYEDYVEIWNAHRGFDGSLESRNMIRDLYRSVVVSSLTSFANRFAPEVKKDRLLLARHGRYALSTRAKITPDFDSIREQRFENMKTFPLCLRLDVNSLKAVHVNVNFLELMQRINDGYRPNTHDKTAVVMLEELLKAISTIVCDTKSLHLQHCDSEWTLTNNHIENEIEVE